MGSPRPNLLPLPSSPSLTPFLFSPSPTSVSTTVATLRLHATYIRDTLFPLLNPDAPYLPSQEFYLLTTILARVSSTRPITTDLLRQSRIVNALQLIAPPLPPDTDKPDQGRWPPDSIIQARKILRHWERELGDIYNLRPNLFASGAPLAGLHLAKLYKTTKKSVIVRDEVRTPALLQAPNLLNGDSDTRYHVDARTQAGCTTGSHDRPHASHDWGLVAQSGRPLPRLWHRGPLPGFHDMGRRQSIRARTGCGTGER